MTGRTQYVQIDNDSSNHHELSFHVPQGSVLGPILYLLYTAPLADIIKHHNLCYHFYADDNQIYMTFKPLINETAPENPKSIIESCLKDINYWMNINKLKLNNGKTELLLIQSPHRPLPPLQNINCGTEMIKPTKSAKNIGVWFDNIMSMSKQVNAICNKAFYHLRNIASIKRFLSEQHCEILIHAFVTSALDCCNSLLYGLPQYQIKKLQHVLNAAARLLTRTGKYEHIIYIFSTVIGRHAPLRSKRVRSSKSPWITSHLKQRMHERDILKKKAIRSNDPNDWTIFTKYRNSVNSEIKQSKESYYVNSFRENEGNSCTQDMDHY